MKSCMVLVTCLGVLLGAPIHGKAQNEDSTLVRLVTQRPIPKDFVRITLADGKIISGRLTGCASDSLYIRVGRRQTLRMAQREVLKAELRKDHRREGAVIGLCVGVISSFFIFVIDKNDQDKNSYTSGRTPFSTGLGMVTAVVLCTGGGALWGQSMHTYTETTVDKLAACKK